MSGKRWTHEEFAELLAFGTVSTRSRQAVQNMKSHLGMTNMQRGWGTVEIAELMRLGPRDFLGSQANVNDRGFRATQVKYLEVKNANIRRSRTD